MKVLLIHPILWSHYKAVVFSALGDICQQHGDELLVLQVAESEGGRRSLGQSERSLHRYPLRLLFEGTFESTSAIARCVKICSEIMQYRPNIIVLPGYCDISYWCALLVSCFWGIPRIITFDSTANDHRRVWYKELIKKLFIRLCNGAFVYGSKAREYLMQLGMPVEKITIRYQATHNQEIAALHAKHRECRDEEQGRMGLKKNNFIYVGRLSHEKNINRLMVVFAQVKRSVIAAGEWGLIVVGDGPLRQQLQTAATSGIVFVGGKSWREVTEYYALADVCILPSTSEPWGLVVNEAMICGLPVIVSDRCGSAHDLVVDGENGFVFDPYNEAELVERMRYFVEHPERIGEMGAASLRIIGDYTPESSARQMYAGLHAVFDSDDIRDRQQKCV